MTHPYNCDTCSKTQCLHHPHSFATKFIDQLDGKEKSYPGDEDVWEFTKEFGCASHSNDAVDDTILRSMRVEGGEIHLETSGGSGHRFVVALVNFYLANGGKNYFTMTVEGVVRKKHHRYEITIRNLDGGKSPAETISELKKELEKAQEKNKSFKNEMEAI